MATPTLPFSRKRSTAATVLEAHFAQEKPKFFSAYQGGKYTSVTAAAKIFYVNSAYNPAAPYDPTHEPSTMRFCQTCHISMSSESYGATNIGTAY